MTSDSRSLDVLLQECRGQIELFRRGQSRDSSACTEIVRRAAAHDEAALATLLELSLPLMAKVCPQFARDQLEDVQQLVSVRLMDKFRNTVSPYQASSFAAYREYLRTTVLSVAINMQRQMKSQSSLDQIGDESDATPRQRSDTELVEARFRLERCLELLTDPLMREVFRRRFMLEERPDEIVAALALQGHNVTKQEVFRLTERSISLLSKLPEVREMFEADLGNDP